MLERKEWTAGEVKEGELALEYIQRVLSLSKREIRILLKYHLAGVNDQMLSGDMMVHEGDEISVTITDEKPEKCLPEEVPLKILYEDDALLVLNKPRGIAVIPGPGNWHQTMTNGLRFYLGEDSYKTFVHRLDKMTSGCLLAAKTKKSAAHLSLQIASKSARRIYRALCEGKTPDSGTIIAPIGRDPQNFRRMAVTNIKSKPAVTNYECLERGDAFSELRFRLETGRTHQIRVHAAYIGHPLIGDDLYGKECEYLAEQGAVLHAETLIFTHPITEERMEVHAPLPAYYTEVKRSLEQPSHI